MTRTAPQVVRLAPGADEAGFRRAVRRLVAGAVPPEAVLWETQEPNLFARAAAPEPGEDAPLRLPRAAAALTTPVLRHRDPARHALLYALVWRVVRGERALAEVASDPLVHQLGRMRAAVGRDLHKMHAFLRFRRNPEGEGFTAWFEPEHHILEAGAAFFADRFPGFAWAILTPDGSARWDGARLAFGPPGTRADLPADDGHEARWRDYYESTFNPARTNLRMMASEMPRKYWHNLPESESIRALVRRSCAATAEMVERGASVPARRAPIRAVAAMAEQAPATLEALNVLIRSSPPMVPGGTRAILGEGPSDADIVLVGEQPGDQEDRQGRPFVGPAGQVLSRALADAGLLRDRLYLTNAVKHFKHVVRGPRRIHRTPTAGEVRHYRWWLERELAFVAPKLVVALGASARLALTGQAGSVTAARGPAHLGAGFGGFVTVHPAYLLRLPDTERADAYAAFVADLRAVRAIAAGLGAA